MLSERYTPSYSRTELVHIVSPADLNGKNRLFGGKLVSLIDETAAIAAKRHCGNNNMLTVAIDNLVFKKGAFKDDLLVLEARVTYTGRTSVEVRVDSYVEDLDGYRRPINRAYLVVVSLDADGRPMEVPPLKVETEGEKAEWEAGEKRRKLRAERRRSGY